MKHQFLCKHCGLTEGLVDSCLVTNEVKIGCNRCGSSECILLPAQIFDQPQLFLDIETMDTRQTAIIPQIGAILVSKYGEIISTLNCVIDLNQPGRTVSSSTMEFWMQQPDAARKEVFCVDTRDSLGDALNKLYEAFAVYKPQVWGNPATFDVAIVTNAAQSLDIRLPWEWFDVRCFHEFKRQYHDMPKPKMQGTLHNALADAKQLYNRYLVLKYFGSLK